MLLKNDHNNISDISHSVYFEKVTLIARENVVFVVTFIQILTEISYSKFDNYCFIGDANKLLPKGIE